MVMTVRFQVWSICWNVSRFGVFSQFLAPFWFIARHPPTRVAMHGSQKPAVCFLMKEQEWGELQRDEDKRYFWLGSRMSAEDVGFWFAPFVTFLPLSFAPNGVMGAASPVHTNTQRDPKHAPIRRKKTHPRLLSTHMRTHAASPSHPHPLSSQRHEDIFIFHKAQTLMKHQRHKYISTIFQMWLQQPRLWHATASLSAAVNVNCHSAWESRWC